MIKKLTYEYVKDYFEKENYKLLSDKYINSSSKLEYICSNGHKGSITYNNFQSGHRCNICSTKISSKKLKLSYEFVKSEFKKVGWQLLSTEYINAQSKLKFICNKGHYNSISYNNFNSGKRCSICYGNKKLTFNFIKSEFEKMGYTLLSTKYKNNSTKLDCICDKGHQIKINFSMFSSGGRCKKCYLLNHSGKNSNLWKGGVTKANLPLYNTYAERLNWIEEVRRGPENNDLLQIRCTNCQKWITPTKTKVESRITSLTKQNKGENRFYCSDECKNTCSIYGQYKYPKGFKVDRTREVQPELAAMVLERDGYECQRCGNKNNLECHHYEGIEQNPIESADIDICVTLCKQCHSLAHKDKGCRNRDLRKENLCK